MSTNTQRTLQDRAAGISRMIRSLARDPTEWDPCELHILDGLADDIAHARTQAVLAMREHGTTDRQIAEALGITQQAVSKRWPGGGRYVGGAGRYRKPSSQH